MIVFPTVLFRTSLRFQSPFGNGQLWRDFENLSDYDKSSFIAGRRK